MSFLNDHNDSAASQTLESILDTTTLRSKLILVQGLLFVTATAKKSASQRCANVEWNLSGSDGDIASYIKLVIYLVF